MMASVLIVGAEESGVSDVAGRLRSLGHRVAQALGADEALAELERAEPDLILMSMTMLGRKGIPLLDSLAARRGDMPPVAVLHPDVVSGAEPAIGRVGPCRVVPTGKHWEQTYARLMECIDPDRATPLQPIAMPHPSILEETPEELVA
jgi:hypothetical protein